MVEEGVMEPLLYPPAIHEHEGVLSVREEVAQLRRYPALLSSHRAGQDLLVVEIVA